jgi:succinate dehydrogenase / fumarate reductase cytochrome b subunit
MVVLGLHLKHGLESAFQTLGFRTRKYSSSIKAITTGLVLLIPITFASIPIFIYIKNI